MGGSKRVQKIALASAAVSLCAVAMLFGTSGTGIYGMLFIGFTVGGTVAALVALLSSHRRGQSAWIRRASAAMFAAFLGLLAWGAYVVRHVPLS